MTHSEVIAEPERLDTDLCQLTDIADGEAMGFVVTRNEAPLRIFVARKGEQIFGYRNSCPHVGVPLDWNSDKFMSFDRMHLLCGTHGARFRVEDGYCVSGPCQGLRLRPVSVRLEAGRVIAAL